MDACTNPDILRTIYFFLIIIDIVKIIIPIGLIIFGLIDFSKSVATNDEKVQKKSGQLFLKRLLYGVFVFFVPWIIEVLMVTLGNLSITDSDINFTDCLENANSQCIDTLDSKNLASIKTTCDVPDDFEIEEDSDDDDSSSGNNFITSDSSITFSYEYVSSGDTMPYALYTPSTARSNKTTPLIVWLHGSGEVKEKASESTLKNSGLLYVLNNWKLDGFNAYVLCPHLAGKGYSSSWNNGTSRKNLNTLLEKIIRENNINTDKIILVGHSLGGQGALYMALNDNYYSALVVLSGYRPGGDISKITIPTKGFVGKNSELDSAFGYMTDTFKDTFGQVAILGGEHRHIPKMAFTIDDNNDGKSDLIEWMLTQ